jgi:hypothetical protein
MNKQKTKLPLTLVTILLTISLIESFTKGWASFFMIPAALIAFPMVRIIHGRIISKFGSRYDLLRLVQIISTFLFFTCAVGFDDSDNGLLFGFLKANVNGQFSNLSSQVSSIAGYIATGSFILLFLILLTKSQPVPVKKA